MELIPTEIPLIHIMIRKSEYTEAMFHTAAPIPLILCPRQKVIPAIAMNLIIDKNTTIFLPIIIRICSPSTFVVALDLSFVCVGIIVCYFYFAVCQLLS